MGTTVTAQMFMVNTLKVFFRKSLIALITNNDFYSDAGDIDEKSTKLTRKSTKINEIAEKVLSELCSNPPILDTLSAEKRT